jgi:hypothetical protein
MINRRGQRPPIGQTPVVSLRLQPEWQQGIDEWRRGEPGQLSRSDAIRILFGMGLSAAYEERKREGREDG